MTRKEAFAAAALTGLLASNQQEDGTMDNPLLKHENGGLFFVETAWRLAEAMECKAIEDEEGE